MSNNIYDSSKNKKTFDHIYGVLFVLLFISLATVIFTMIRTDVVTNSVLKNENLPFLLLVRDENGPIMTEAVLYNAKTKRLALIDIPYDAGDLLPKLKRSDRYSVFYQQGDKDSYRNSIEQLLNLKFLFTLDLHIKNLVKLVDLLEGIRLYFFAPVNRVDPVSKKHYIYNAGEQYLDGDQSRDFFYAGLGTVDYDKYSTNEVLASAPENTDGTREDNLLRRNNLRYAYELLLGIVATLQKYSTEREDYIGLLYSYFETDLSKRSFRKLLLYMSEIDVKATEVIFQDYLGKERMVKEQKINFPVYDGQVLRSQVVRISTQLHTHDEIITKKYPVRVEILNGTNVTGLASRTGELYSSEGFDVINIGNAHRSDYDKTLIINLHSNSLDDVQRVADVIGAKNVIMPPLPGGEQAEAEVRIVLGRDFNGSQIAP